MSTMEVELNSMNTTSDGSPVVTGDENEQKSIAVLDELLEQELKEGDSVDCFIKRVGDTSEDSSEFSLTYDEAPVVSSTAFYSPKEEASMDNNSSSLEKEFEITLNKEKEVPFISDENKLQSGDEETKDETHNTNVSVEDIDEGTKETEEEGDDMLNKHGLDSVQNQDESSMVNEGRDSDVKDQIDKEHNVVEDTTKGKETGDEVHDSVEVTLPSEIPTSGTEQTEKDTNTRNTKAQNVTEAHKDILFLVFHPKHQVNQKNDGGQDNESKKTVQCTENSTSSDHVIASNTGPDKPITKTVLTIAGSSEAKNGKEINKSIIVKKITAKIIKNVNTNPAKPANESEINDHTSDEECLSSLKSSEPEEKQHKKPDDTKEEEPQTAIHSDAASVEVSKPNIIITKKVYGNSKKNPKVLQEKQVPTTEDTEASNIDKPDHQSNTGEGKNLVLGNGVNSPGKTKAVVSNEGKTLPGKLEVNGNKSDECPKKRTTNFGAVKRKFEEICRISREEEDAAIEEIKKMKKETLGVLKKINAEMEKLKLVFLAEK